MEEGNEGRWLADLVEWQWGFLSAPLACRLGLGASLRMMTCKLLGKGKVEGIRVDLLRFLCTVTLSEFFTRDTERRLTMTYHFSPGSPLPR